VQLLKKTPVTLPLLNVQLPIVEFYVVIPWLLWLFHFNLLLHLTFLAQRLHRLNIVLTTFADHVAREEQRIRLFPFPFSVMLIGRHHWGRMRVLLGFMVWITVIFLPLGLLLLIQGYFLPYHNTLITWSHRGAVLADIMLLWFFRPLMLVPEQRAAGQTAWTRRIWPGRDVFCSTLVVVMFSLGIAVLPGEYMEGLMASIPWRHVDPAGTGNPVFMPTYWLFERPRAPFHRNLWLQEQVLVAGDPSAEVLAALRSSDEHERVQGLKKITNLTLTRH
jgi:hypothetical protein